ncbi:MAG: endonuclease/exonuclease/phosphatase family protein [Planctomycetota bacterium]
MPGVRPKAPPNSRTRPKAGRPVRTPIAKAFAKALAKAWRLSRRISARALAWGATGLVTVWLLGALLNDRWLWSQWLWWIPTAFAAIGAGVAVALSRWLARDIAKRARALGVGAAAFATLALAIETRPLNAFRSHEPPSGSTALEPISIGYWNLSWAEPKPAAAIIEEGLLDTDVLVVTNPRPRDGRRDLSNAISARYGGPSPEDPFARASNVAHIAHTGFTTVASRFPILAYGRVGLTGFRTAWTRKRLSNAEVGVTFVRLDTSALLPNPAHSSPGGKGRGEGLSSEVTSDSSSSASTPQTTEAGRMSSPSSGPSGHLLTLGEKEPPHVTTLWIVDLPSDPFINRNDLMAQMRRDLDAWNGRVTSMDHVGRWRTIETNDAFPEPDLIVGDFNTPRGSRSLDALTDRENAHAAVGLGHDHTWPRPVPLWAIDLAFYDPRTFVPVRTEAVEAGHSFHRALRMTVRPLSPVSPNSRGPG